MKGITEQDRDRVMRAKSLVLEALDALGEIRAENLDSEERIASIVSALEAADDGLADELKEYELEERAQEGDDGELHWEVHAETRGDGVKVAGRMGATNKRGDAEKYADALRENNWGGVTVRPIE